MDVRYLIGADFGQTYDSTAVAVVERRLTPTGEPYQHEVSTIRLGERHYQVRQPVETSYDLVRLDRVPLRTPYTKIASGIVTMVKELYDRHAGEVIAEAGGMAHPPGEGPLSKVRVGLAIDEGGVGKAVRDILIQAMSEGLEDGPRMVRFLPVTVHGGSSTTYTNGFIHTPKRDLISAGLVCFQNKKLKVGNLKWRDVLEKELTNYRLKQNLATGHAAFEPLREGEHDDLLFAVCLACWAWERALPKKEYRTLENHILTDIKPPHLRVQYG
jgi:hypothetical protein